MISPELAATVVKDFILPMFETDGKKLLKKKALNKLNGAGATGGEMKLTSGAAKSLLAGSTSGTVFQELKLSEMLQKEVYELRTKIKQLEEQNQEQVYLRECTVTEIRNCKL